MTQLEADFINKGNPSVVPWAITLTVLFILGWVIL
jgi:uncharacterized membrane protein YhdT